MFIEIYYVAVCLLDFVKRDPLTNKPRLLSALLLSL